MQDLDYYKAKVMSVTGVSLDEFESKSRKREFVEARQAFFLIATKRTTCSLKKIASYAGGIDHSTVIHGCDTMKDLMKTDPRRFAWVKQIMEEEGPITIEERLEYKKAERLCLVAYESLRSGHLTKAYKALIEASELLASPEITDELLSISADQKQFEEVNG